MTLYDSRRTFFNAIKHFYYNYRLTNCTAVVKIRDNDDVGDKLEKSCTIKVEKNLIRSLLDFLRANCKLYSNKYNNEREVNIKLEIDSEFWHKSFEIERENIDEFRESITREMRMVV